MDEAMIVLGKRALACKGWRWKPGMLSGWAGAHPHARVSAVDDAGVPSLWQVWPVRGGAALVYGSANWDPRTVPDFRDDATVGCLEALVREVTGEPHMHVRPVLDGGKLVEWVASESAYYAIGCGATKAEALVAALEGAP
jgi:hypothetical protein